MRPTLMNLAWCIGITLVGAIVVLALRGRRTAGPELRPPQRLTWLSWWRQWARDRWNLHDPRLPTALVFLVFGLCASLYFLIKIIVLI
jgi:hypothetical protein